MTQAATSLVVSFLDELLSLRDVADHANAYNGLQVENHGEVGWIVAAVDASLATIGAVARAKGGRPGLLIVHHGLFWDGAQPVTGRRFQRVSALIRHDIALYSAHIPLDLHPEIGNNALLARRIGLEIEGQFGDYHGAPIGTWGRAPASIRSRDGLVTGLAKALGVSTDAITFIAGGPTTIQRVGVITGAAGDMVAAAREAGLDTFITGEGPHHSYFDAMEWGINLVYAGHYATETLGVQALAGRAADRFGLPWEFSDHPTGL